MNLGIKRFLIKRYDLIEGELVAVAKDILYIVIHEQYSWFELDGWEEVSDDGHYLKFKKQIDSCTWNEVWLNNFPKYDLSGYEEVSDPVEVSKTFVYESRIILTNDTVVGSENFQII